MGVQRESRSGVAHSHSTGELPERGAGAFQAHEEGTHLCLVSPISRSSTSFTPRSTRVGKVD